MKTIALAWTYLWARPLAALLNVALLALGVACAGFVLIVADQFNRAFDRDLAGIDLVVGAKGSPMQLILSGVLHIDVPTGNVPLRAVQVLRQHPLVAQVMPLSLGDAVGGFRIVGSEPEYLAHYGAVLARGQAWQQPLQAVLGAQVAQGLRLDVGAQFSGAHGLGGGGNAHAAHPFTVTGVLAPCGCVLDRLVLTSLQSVWAVHEHAPRAGPAGMAARPQAAASGTAGHNAHDADHADEHDAADHDHVADDTREVTVALLRYRSPLAAVQLPRQINAQTGMQAAAPALEVSRLLRMLGAGTQVLRALAGVLLAVAGLSVFVALWNAVRERQGDLAMLRMLGAPPARLAALVLSEALWLAALAVALGLALAHGLAALLAQLLAAERSLPLQAWAWAPGESAAVLAALGVAVLAAAVPVWRAYRVDVAQLLQA